MQKTKFLSLFEYYAAAEELPLDALRQVWQEGAALSESEKQFSFTCAALGTRGRARKQIQSIQIETQAAL